jgi:two-component system sensor histidine kinase BarA
MNTVIDTKLALEQAAGNEQLAKELFAMLLQELPVHREAITAAHAAGDLEALWEPAHKLYGATAYCGVPALRAAAKQLEDAIRNAQWPAIGEGIKGLHRAMDELHQHGEQAMAQPW